MLMVAARARADEAGTQEGMIELQRSRLMNGAIAVLDELGYPRTTVAHITDRARVSRRTFYELFANREECFAAVLDEAVAALGAELACAVPPAAPWEERVRAGLRTILAFLDRDPALARVCVVQAARADGAVLARRRQLLVRLAAILDEGAAGGARGAQRTALTAEGLVGAAFAILDARLQRRERRPLTALLGELMGMIVLPYRGPAAARRERERPAPSALVPKLSARVLAPRDGREPLGHLPMRLTYRTTRVLEVIAGCPGASNRVVAERAGVADPGQISKLLARLRRLDLLANGGAGHVKGEPNAWRLTPAGERLVRSIRLHGGLRSEAA